MPSISTPTGSVTVDTSAADYVVFGVSGTYAGFTGDFWGLPTGSSNYQRLIAPRLDGGSEPGPVLLTNATRAWRIVTKALSSVKLVAIALASGTVTVETSTDT